MATVASCSIRPKHCIQPTSTRPLDPAALGKFLQRRVAVYDKDRDGHYNLISAFHKSLRGSDPQAALYYMARMLTAGEEPLYVLRRLVRFASEDIGLADPDALVQCLAAKDAYAFLGSPEGELAMVQACLYCATAPKSNAAYAAQKAAWRNAKETGSLMPPANILNAPTRLMKDIGYGEGLRLRPCRAGRVFGRRLLAGRTGPANILRTGRSRFRTRGSRTDGALGRTSGQAIMNRFEHFVAIDWSGAKGPKQPGIAIAVCSAEGGPPVLVDAGGGWSRTEVLDLLRNDLPENSLVGLDLGIGLPYADCDGFFPGWSETPRSAEELWALIDTISATDPNLGVNSFVEHPAIAPYYHDGVAMGSAYKCDGAAHNAGRLRVTEHAQRAMGCKPYSNFRLVGAAQVGKSSLTGMRMLHHLRGRLPVWPIDPLPGEGSVVVEIYTALAAMAGDRSARRSKVRSYADLNDCLTALGSPQVAGDGAIDDHSSDALLTAAWLRKVADRGELWNPPALTPQIARTEGWTFGAI